MLNSLIESIFGCAHHRTTFPITPARGSNRQEGARRGTYIVCLDCGKEFDYNWKSMRIGNVIPPAADTMVRDQPDLIQAIPIRTEQRAAH